MYRQFLPLPNGGGIYATFCRGSIRVFSAGLEPSVVNPRAIQVMHEDDVDISKHTSKHVDQFIGQNFDYVITVCDNANERCPVFPGRTKRIHWSFEDPAAQGEPKRPF